jgi:hypothetical protein
LRRALLLPPGGRPGRCGSALCLRRRGGPAADLQQKPSAEQSRADFLGQAAGCPASERQPSPAACARVRAPGRAAGNGCGGCPPCRPAAAWSALLVEPGNRRINSDAAWQLKLVRVLCYGLCASVVEVGCGIGPAEPRLCSAVCSEPSGGVCVRCLRVLWLPGEVKGRCVDTQAALLASLA